MQPSDSTLQVASHPATASLLDQLIAVLVVLLILSLITEKITNLIRRQSEFWGREQAEDVRELRILGLSTVVGIVVAFLTNADVLALLSDPSNLSKHAFNINGIASRLSEGAGKADAWVFWSTLFSVIFWVTSLLLAALLVEKRRLKAFLRIDRGISPNRKGAGYLWFPVVTLILAIIFTIVAGLLGELERLNLIFTWTISLLLTGFFLSFGSKFFHDLLDTLLQVKNLKRKLNDERTYSFDKVEDLKVFLEATDNDLAHAAYEQNQHLLDLPNVVGLTVGEVPSGGQKSKKGLLIYIEGSDWSGLPVALSAKLPNGQHILIPHKVIEGHEIAEAYLGPGPGEHIVDDLEKGIGTLCCVLQHTESKKKYLLTCGHVLNGGLTKADKAVGKNASVKGLDNPVGVCKEAVINNRLDIALVELNENAGKVLQNSAGAIELKVHRRVKDGDVHPVQGLEECRIENVVANKAVTTVGARSGTKEGYIINRKASYKIRYSGDDQVLKLDYLLMISQPGTRNRCQSLTVRGDSGAVVVDKDNHILGMVVGGTKRFTLAIPMSTMFRIPAFKNMEIA